MDAWHRWSGTYIAFALTLFVYLLSRKLAYAALAAIIFSFLAWTFRVRALKADPIMLAIAAVTLPPLQQRSLGALFLRRPDPLGAPGGPPVRPVSFFLSSIAAGTSLVILVEMGIARAWNRQFDRMQLAALGEISFWALAVYLTFRLGDMIMRGQLSKAFSGKLGVLFAAEIVLGCIVPLLLLSRARLRARTHLLFVGSLLIALGVAFNRLNVVLLAMSLKGPMPQVAPSAYFPSVFEWGISIGLVAATIFLFGLTVRLMPVLPKRSAIQ